MGRKARTQTPLTDNDPVLGMYFKEISRYTPLSSEEESRLAGRIKKGDTAALRKLVTANVRFVVSVARTYQHQGMSLKDLIGAGNMGLIKAAHKFEPSKNFRFISYAVWWIRQAILQALAEHSRLYRVPLNRIGEVYKVNRAHERVEQKKAGPANSDDIAAHAQMSVKTVELSCRIARQHTSLDRPLSPAGPPLVDTLEDERVESPDERLVKVSDKTHMAALLNSLDRRERQVIEMHFGIDRDCAYTLEDIGRRLKLTRERVRQIEKRALTRLRSMCDVPCS